MISKLADSKYFRKDNYSNGGGGLIVYVQELFGNSRNLVIKCSNIDIHLSCFEISQMDIIELASGR